jgi:hypothetical protein
MYYREDKSIPCSWHAGIQGRRGMALLLNLDKRWTFVVTFMSRHFPRGKNPVIIE